VSTLAPAPESDALPKVLYIAGWQRSGTTILDRVLGQLEGFVSTGELRRLWEASLSEGYLCGCGAPLPECEFWRAAQEAGGLEASPREGRRLVELQRRHVHTRPRELLAIRRGIERRARLKSSALDPYAEARLRLFAGLRKVTGADVVVDSSKHPADAYLLTTLPQLDLYVVHLIRDPRAVAYSWSRMVRETADPRGRLLDGFGSLSSSVWWLVWNAAIETLLRRRLGERYLRLRYEDFVERPAEAVRSIGAFLDEPRLHSPVDEERTVYLHPDHTVSGNPRTRFRRGTIELRADVVWRSRMSAGSKALSTVVAIPLLRHYGYRVVD
jgi:hypothetical protein